MARALKVLVRLGVPADGVEEEAEVVLDERAVAHVPRLLPVVARGGVLDERAVERAGPPLGAGEVLQRRPEFVVKLSLGRVARARLDEGRGLVQGLERRVVAVGRALDHGEPDERRRTQLFVKVGGPSERALAPVADGQFGLRLFNPLRVPEPLEKRGTLADKVLRGFLRAAHVLGAAQGARQLSGLQQHLGRHVRRQALHGGALADAPPQIAQSLARPLVIAGLLVSPRHLATELRAAPGLKV